MHGSACPPIKPWILQKGWWIVIYHHLSQYYLKKFTLYFFSGLGTFSKITKLKKICDLNYGWMEIFSIFWLKDMKSALKNESKDTGWKSRDWNQGRTIVSHVSGPNSCPSQISEVQNFKWLYLPNGKS